MCPSVSDSSALISWHFLARGADLSGDGNAVVERGVEPVDFFIGELDGELVEVQALQPFREFTPK
ncbi:hypothetical protein [Haematomicrobium sanguinis]|uniref:hypothetical protein n=1 Tax=Haematomicrobium sanguinis TaxID=479106 RepID=UPI000479781D|nr:hypothetical protein [Haematomicrobium sanguinis]